MPRLYKLQAKKSSYIISIFLKRNQKKYAEDAYFIKIDNDSGYYLYSYLGCLPI